MVNQEAMFENVFNIYKSGGLDLSNASKLLGRPGDEDIEALLDAYATNRKTLKECVAQYQVRLELVDVPDLVKQTIKKAPLPKRVAILIHGLQQLGVEELDEKDKKDFTFDFYKSSHFTAFVSLVRSVYPMDKLNQNRHHQFLVGLGLVEEKEPEVEEPVELEAA